MDGSQSYFDAYQALPAEKRKKVLKTLRKWGGWTKTSVYRKLQCPNLSPIEQILVEGVMKHAQDPQLEIAFSWSETDGFILCP